MTTIAAFICWLIYSIFIYIRSAWRSERADRYPQSWLYSIPVFVLALAGGSTLWFLWRAELLSSTALWVLFAVTVCVQTGLLALYMAGWYLFVRVRGEVGSFDRDIHGSGGFPEAVFAWSAMLWMILAGQHLNAAALTLASAAWLVPALGIKMGYGIVRIHAGQSTREKQTRSSHGPVDRIVLFSTSVLPVLVAAFTSNAPVAIQVGCSAVVAFAYFLAYRHDLITWAILTSRPSILFSEAGPNDIALTLVKLMQADPAVESVLLRRLRSRRATEPQIADVCAALSDRVVFSIATADNLLQILRERKIPSERRAYIATRISTASREGQVVWGKIAEDQDLCNMLKEERGLTITKTGQ